MNRYLPGHRPLRETVSVDYADVLRQAIENERWRVLREVRREVERVETTKPGRTNYSSDPRNGSDVKRDVLAALDRVERATTASAP